MNGHIRGLHPQTQKLESPHKTLSSTLAVKGLIRPGETGRKQTNYATESHANDFLNAKSRAREKPLLTGYSKTSPITVSSRNAPMNEALCDDTKIGAAEEEKLK